MFNFKKFTFIITSIALLTVSLCLTHCKAPKSNLGKTAYPNINYTYWWDQTGPFIGNCGEKYGAVFLGKLVHLQQPIEKKNYRSKKGLIQIDSVLYNQKNLLQIKKNTFITSDCFTDVKAKEGDLILVFCYIYQNELSIPGGKSIIKLDDVKDPLVLSTTKYLQANQNPLIIEEDLYLWSKEGLGNDLKQVLHCRKMLN